MFNSFRWKNEQNTLTHYLRLRIMVKNMTTMETDEICVCVWERERGNNFLQAQMSLEYRNMTSVIGKRSSRLPIVPGTSIHLVEVKSLKHCPHPPSTFQLSLSAWYLHKLQHGLQPCLPMWVPPKRLTQHPLVFEIIHLLLCYPLLVILLQNRTPSNLDNHREAEWLYSNKYLRAFWSVHTTNLCPNK